MSSDKSKGLKSAIRPFIPEGILQYRNKRIRRKSVQLKARSAGLTVIERDVFFDLMKNGDVLRIKRDHEIYLEHMIENFDYYIASVIPVRVNDTNLVDMSGPRYHRLRGFSDIPFLFPSHTEPYATTAEYLDFADLEEGETVLDIGAYAGITSIIFAQLVGPSGRVYAFEADKVNYECALSNIEMAERVLGLKNITLINKAIWSDSDGLLFSNEGAMGSSAVSITGADRGNVQCIPSIRLEDFFAEQKLTHADFIKIDIEGCEVEVLEASARFLKTIQAKLIIEPHLVNGVLSTDRCYRYLVDAGFHVRVREKVGESEPLIEAVS